MSMHEIFAEVAAVVTRRHIIAGGFAILILVVGLFIARRASAMIGNLSRLDLQQRLVFQKASYYSLTTLTLAMALNQLGFDLKVLLGAAGVLTVAIGFAAQTSASNLISGLFLMADPPFTLGQTVVVGDITGDVVSIGLLSCRIRTPDNRMVRIPNEAMIRTNIANLSHFPIRRVDLNLFIDYASSIADVRKALQHASDSNPLILDEPKPTFIFSGFSEHSVRVQYQCWTITSHVTEAQNRLFESAKSELEAAHIRLAPAQRVMNMELPTQA